MKSRGQGLGVGQKLSLTPDPEPLFFMEPEISRRCPTCGAAVRVRATFCPNCGRPMGNGLEKPSAEEQSGADNLPETNSLPKTTATNKPDVEAKDDIDSPAIKVTGKEGAPAVTFVKQGEGVGAPSKRHRVRTAAREAVEENLLPRVEKLRQASNVVLDEAAYDPSLRFILIALALFLIFLVILLASNILG